MADWPATHQSQHHSQWLQQVEEKSLACRPVGQALAAAKMEKPRQREMPSQCGKWRKRALKCILEKIKENPPYPHPPNVVNEEKEHWKKIVNDSGTQVDCSRGRGKPKWWQSGKGLPFCLQGHSSLAIFPIGFNDCFQWDVPWTAKIWEKVVHILEI